ncbi:LOW QUALITY PROTEIN: cytosolic phospholipase A2 beta-like [Lampris incognitus]|uniref:LOW QUALITY PROTEIN: cytosolic phospholipase A2 beta-like n=1 Tax=Lampris incognitus TaxID=2546036 RepID=UPI0024B5F8B6|nr:LOW QUALITY PROTEIN: cytosolic phospholipase A2 beta-like [Lampris incognitus]
MAWTSAAAAMKDASTMHPKPSVRLSHPLSAGEQEYIHKRKDVVLRTLNSLGITTTLDSVPHIALLASGGGQRAAVALMGSLHQMEQDGLLDTLLYLGGVSGSTWSMSLLYSDPWWSGNMGRAVSRLTSSEVGLEDALAWLGERMKKEDFSLTDIWAVITAGVIMKQLDFHLLSEESGRNAMNPYPIYSAIEKTCHQNGPTTAKWFEMTPHESGFTELGLFINTSHLASQPHVPERQEMDMVKLQGVMGSVLADEQAMVNNFPDWLKAPQQAKSVWDVLQLYTCMHHTVNKLMNVIRTNTDDPTSLSELDDVQKTLKENLNLLPFVTFQMMNPEERREMFDRWSQEMLKPLEAWIQIMEEGPYKEYVSRLTGSILHLIGRWEWGTTENFLYRYPNASVPFCLRSKQNLHLIDTGLHINMPFTPFLGHKRDIDLFIALEFSEGDIFKTLTLAKNYAAKVKKPFPEIDDKVLQEKDWPKDFYVFEGKHNEPTIIYMPLFNRHNCKDAEEVRQRMEEYSTFQLPYSQEKIEFLLETAKDNMKNNKDAILREVHKAAQRRQSNG